MPTITRKVPRRKPTARRSPKPKQGPDEMGRVVIEALIENIKDVYAVELGVIDAANARKVQVDNALVDTGATLVSLPKRMIKQLGLAKISEKRVISSAGITTAGMFGPIRLTIQGRSCTMDVMEVPKSVPVLIGQIPLEHLDFVIDMRSHKLTGNPAHGGEHMYELF